VALAKTLIPEEPGLYAIHVDAPGNLPPRFAEKLSCRPNQTLLYIGKAGKNLRKRVWEQECQHLSPGTFFRSVGVMLGYVSPAGGAILRLP
jgi:hypothetical protein